MKEINKIRKIVCTMANELKKAGYSLSQAFRKAWSRVKLSMTVRVTGIHLGTVKSVWNDTCDKFSENFSTHLLTVLTKSDIKIPTRQNDSFCFIQLW